ncbi:MAG: phytase [Pseudonocardiales bacterium]|nr:phytase [Pseudonocardiales bacterium]
MGRSLQVRRIGMAALVAMLVVGAAVGIAAPAGAAIPPITPVSADAETVPVANAGDAADDPAVWVHPTDGAASLLIGNDKLGALEVYDLGGGLRQRITTGTSFWGNVDVRQGVDVGGRTVDVVATFNAGLRLYTVDVATRRLRAVTDGTGVYPTTGEGLCLHHSAATGDVSAFVISRAGFVRQFRLTDGDADGLLEAAVVREFAVGSEAEGCVADDDRGLLYIAEERTGLWRYGAEPGAGDARTLVDAVQPGGHLAADAEGVTLVDTGADAGYLVVSAQNTADPTQSYFATYDRQTNAFTGAFRIVDGTAADGCTRTDGITASTAALGPAFPAGVFVCQDDANGPPGGTGNQDFKLTRLERVVDLAGAGTNRSPTAAFTTSCSATTCTFDASASTDPDGSVVSYAWDFGDGATGTGPVADHTYAGSAPQVVTLTVRDGEGAIGFASGAATPTGTTAQIVQVAAAATNGNRTTHAVQIPGQVRQGDTLLVFFAGNVATTVTPPAGFAQVRAVGADGAVGRLWWRTATAADAGRTIGVTTPVLVKSDLTVAAYRGVPATSPAAGARIDTTVAATRTTPQVTVAEPGSWLVSYWADRSSTTTAWATPPGQVTRSATTGSGGGHITAVLTDGAAPVATGTRGGLAATANSAGSRAVTLSVVLAPGGTAANLPPTAAFTVSCVQLECTLDASGSTDPDGTPVAFAWDFGDGTTGSGASVSHAYTTPGPRTVTLTVTDDRGATATTTLAVEPTAAADTVAFVAAAATNGNRSTHVVTVPADVQPGDALLLFLTGNVSTTTVTGPAGWTPLQSVSASGIIGRVWWREAVAGDAGSTVTVTSSGLLKSDLTVAAYRGAGDPPVGTSAGRVDTATTAVHLTPAVTVPESGSWLVSYWADKSAETTAWTPPAGQTVRATTTGSGGGHVTALLADGNGPVPPGTRGGLAATADAASSRAVSFSVVVDLQG